MKPIPVVFHVGPLQIHTYGIGLAITFYVAYRYFERRLRRHGYPTDWVGELFLWVIASAIIGARAFHVATNWSYYGQQPGEIPMVWHGGLSSFGGLILAVPVALWVSHRRCPQLGVLRGLDLVAPVLLAAWAMGRLLGPQLMYAGGGHATSAWYGMAYAGQPGNRVPVPLLQALEDGLTYLVLLAVEWRCAHDRQGQVRSNYPAGAVTATAMILWGVSRTLDERYLLGGGGNVGSLLVQGAGVALVLGGVLLAVGTARRWRRYLEGQPSSSPSLEGAARA